MGRMKRRILKKIFNSLAALIILLSFVSLAGSEEGKPKIVLERAVMCESIENFKPVNPAVVFSISQQEVYCYSNFDPVYEKSYIFHKWFKKDKLIFTMRLTLSPPKWSSFSRIQLRDEDKGPWRVEVRDGTGRLLNTLRFSMVD